MPLYNPPPDIERDLKAFDPALRLRWSDAQGGWRLERKVAQGAIWPASVVESPAQFEGRIAANDGYILVEFISPEHLSGQLIPVLARSDIWTNGGAQAVADAMDELDISHRQMMKAMMSDQFAAMARERFRYMNRVRTVPEKFAHTAPPGGMSINGGL